MRGGAEDMVFKAAIQSRQRSAVAQEPMLEFKSCCVCGDPAGLIVPASGYDIHSWRERDEAIRRGQHYCGIGCLQLARGSLAAKEKRTCHIGIHGRD